MGEKRELDDVLDKVHKFLSEISTVGTMLVHTDREKGLITIRIVAKAPGREYEKMLAKQGMYLRERGMEKGGGEMS